MYFDVASPWTASYSDGVDAITLTDLAAVVAAVLGPTLAAVVALSRYQHKDSNETRQLISEARDEFRTGIAAARDETRNLISEHRRENGESLREVLRSLADARERLARLEGHLGIGGSPRDEDGRGTADAA